LGYEVLIMLHLADDSLECVIWMEDDHRNFITFIPPHVDPPINWYGFNCHGNGQKNRIATLNTLDNSTTYWVHAGLNDWKYTERIRGGYNENKCFDLHGVTSFKWYFEENDYNYCKSVRDGN
ncbi:18029_t:CDS:2, partial [Funneliformis geosporum]